MSQAERDRAEYAACTTDEERAAVRAAAIARRMAMAASPVRAMGCPRYGVSGDCGPADWSTSTDPQRCDCAVHGTHVGVPVDELL